MLISVVIPTCDRHADLSACLERVAPGRQTLDAAKYEVIVSDDGKSSASAALAAQFPWVRWVEGPRRGPAANRNCGASQARGDWLAFTDDDCLPTDGWLDAFAAAIARDEARVLEGRTSPVGLRSRVDMECPANETGGLLWSCNFAIQRSLYSEMNGFDERFPGPAMEDIDLHWRLGENGVLLAFIPEAQVRHAWRIKKGPAHQRLAARSFAYLLTKHPRARTQFTVRAILVSLARAFATHLPRAVREVGVQGLMREMLLVVDKTARMLITRLRYSILSMGNKSNTLERLNVSPWIEGSDFASKMDEADG
jgi:GT2 family glycosyltransferase